MRHDSPVRPVLAAIAAAVAAVVVVGLVGTGAAAADPVPNGDVEAGVDAPTCFSPAGWGENTAAMGFSADARSGARSLAVELTERTSGDRKWLVTESDACAPEVVPGERYELEVWVKSTSPVNSLTVYRQTATSWAYWTDLVATGETGGAWVRLAGVTPEVPAGTTRLSFGVSISAPGTLLTDDYAISLASPAAEPTVSPSPSGTPSASPSSPASASPPTTASPSASPTGTGASPTASPTGTASPPPADPDELLVNGGLELGDTVPDCFVFSGWGDGVVTGERAAGRTGQGWRTSLSGHTAGDHKLLVSDAPECAPYVTEGQSYEISLWYRSTGETHGLTLFRQTAAGWEYWTDLRTVPGSADWAQVAATTPPVPAGTTRLSFGLSLAGDGVLHVDDHSMRLPDPDVEPAPEPTPEPTGEPTGDPTDGPTGPPVDGDPAEVGRWTVADYEMPSRTIHSTVLVDGRVLLIAGSGNDVDLFAAGSFTAEVFDPATGDFTSLDVPDDMFCAGHVTLADGRVLIMGGTADYPTDPLDINYPGLPDSWVFTPGPDTFTKVNDAQTGHWYPTLTRLADGNVWAAGGLREDRTGTVNTEMFDVGEDRWLDTGEVPQTWSFWGLYPHMFLLEDGRLFYSGGHVFGDGLPGTGASLYRWETGEIEDVPGLRNKDMRDQAASVLLPPAQDQRVAIIGGGNVTTTDPAISDVDLIDLRDPAPAYAPGPDLPGPGKMYVNAVLLPDRSVFTTGGARHNRMDEVLTAALYDPVAEAWTSVVPDPVARQYHSTAVLLPDGRVMAIGSNPGDGSFEHRVSFYEPPYLFAGERPVIDSAPATLDLGGAASLGVTTAPGATVQEVSLVSPMSVTHQSDPNLRLVDVPFVTAPDGSLELAVPENANLLLPGPYMLVVTDDTGVPSVARWVSVQ